MWLLLMTWWGACAADSWLPAVLTSTHAGDPVLSAYVQVGDPPTERLFALDFASDVVRVVYNPPTFSRAYDPVYLGSPHDQYVVGGHAFMLETVEQAIEATTLPPGATGIMGVGASSMVWAHFERVTITGKELSFTGALPSWRHGDTVACAVGPTLCEASADVTVDGTAFGASTVIIPLATARTQLPLPIYDAIVGDRHPSSTPLGDWPQLCLRWGASGRTCWTGYEYVTRGPLNTRHLLIEPSPDAIIRLGASAMLGMRAARAWSGPMVIADFSVAMSYSWWTLLLIVCLMFLYFMRWRPVSYESIDGPPGALHRVVTYIIAMLGALAPTGAAVYGSIAIAETWVQITILVYVAAAALVWGVLANFVLAANKDNHLVTSVSERVCAGTVRDAVRDVGYVWSALIFASQVRTVAFSSTLGLLITLNFGLALLGALLVAVTVLMRERISLGYMAWLLSGGLAGAAAVGFVLADVILPGAHWLAPAGETIFGLTTAATVTGCTVLLFLLATPMPKRVAAWRHAHLHRE